MPAENGREWITVKEFVKRHGIGRNLVYESVRRRRIRSLRLRGKILIAADALDQLAGASREDASNHGRG
jgi:excisionase family DNA binding protein